MTEMMTQQQSGQPGVPVPGPTVVVQQQDPALTRQIAELTAQVQSMAAAQQAQPETLSAEQLKNQYGLSDDQIDSVGVEALNAHHNMMRRAMAGVQETVQASAEQIRYEERERAFHGAMNSQVPGWQAISNSPGFKQFTQIHNPNLVNELVSARQSQDPWRVIAVFRQFEQAQYAPPPPVPNPNYPGYAQHGMPPHGMPRMAPELPPPPPGFAPVPPQFNIPGGPQMHMMPTAAPTPQHAYGQPQAPVYAVADVAAFFNEFAKGNHQTEKGFATLQAYNLAISEGRVL